MKRCNHSRAWEFFLDHECHPCDSADPKQNICKWCPDCGAIAYWNKDWQKSGKKVIWMKPQNKN